MEMEQIKAYAAAHADEARQLTEELCRIPAPSGKERARAEFCRDWLERCGTKDVRIDGADNMVLELNAAHPAVAALRDAVESDPEKAKKYAELLYCQGLLMANLPLEDPTAYTDLVCELMK